MVAAWGLSKSVFELLGSCVAAEFGRRGGCN